MTEEILYRYLRGETTPAEDVLVAEWLEADPEAHRKELDAVRFIFEGMELYGREIRAAVGASRRNSQPWARAVRYAVRIAAVVVLALTGGYLVQRQTLNTISDRMTVVQVPYGQRIELTLADGSSVWLNSGARLEYPVVFKKKLRKVRLSGEALFEVRHDAACPFEVETFASNIRVLGTRFNVEADEQHRKFSTTLLDGRVRVANLLDPRQPEIVMKPNDVVNLSDGRLFVDRLRNADALCWTEGLVNIDGLPFDELMAKFEQVFDVRIVVSRRDLPDIGSIRGKIRVNDGIENALHILQYGADFTFEKDEENNIVTIL